MDVYERIKQSKIKKNEKEGIIDQKQTLHSVEQDNRYTPAHRNDISTGNLSENMHKIPRNEKGINENT